MLRGSVQLVLKWLNVLVHSQKDTTRDVTLMRTNNNIQLNRTQQLTHNR